MLTPYFRLLGLIKKFPECFGVAGECKCLDRVLDHTSVRISLAFLWKMNVHFGYKK